MKLKASLKSHSPEQIYAYITHHIGKVSLLVKKGCAIITLQKKQHYDLMLKDHKVIRLGGKPISFKPYYEYEPLTDGKENETTELMELQSKIQFDPLTQAEALLFKEKTHLIKVIEEKFKLSISALRQKQNQIRKLYTDEYSQKHSIHCLREGIEKKVEKITLQYESNINKIINFIENYTVSSDPIDLCLSFKQAQLKEFPSINPDAFTFELKREYKNLEKYPIKRLQALNGSEFITTMKDKNSHKGFVRFYNVQSSTYRQSFDMEHGCYGVCVSNNAIFIGNYKGRINYINLNNSQIKVQTCDQVLHGKSYDQCSIYDIKARRKGEQSLIYSLGMDNCVRIWNVSNDEILPSVYSLSNFQKQFEWQCSAKTLGFEVANQINILLGSQNNFFRVDSLKQRAYKIKLGGAITKIKKFNDSTAICAAGNRIQMLDWRDSRSQVMFQNLKDIKSLQVIEPHTIVFGGDKYIGIVDERKDNQILWRDKSRHRGIVTDITRIDNYVISADSSGIVNSWRFSELPE